MKKCIARACSSLSRLWKQQEIVEDGMMIENNLLCIVIGWSISW